jgi:multiple sugar transport system substrate-binding protein
MLWLGCLAVAVAGLAGCGSGSGNNAQKGDGDAVSSAPAAKTAVPSAELGQIDKPVTLQFMNWGKGKDANFDRFVANAQKHFPNLTLNVMPYEEISKKVIAGDLPDIMYGSTNLIQELIPFDVVGDITPLVKKYNYDLSQINPLMLEDTKNNAGGSILAGLPVVGREGQVLYYNKDLFNRFGVAYPVDGMTWDQVYALAQKMNRTADGVHYAGLLGRWNHTYFQDGANILGVRMVSPTQDAATLDDPSWSKLVNNWKRFMELPGNEWTAKNIGEQQVWQQFPKGTAAMSIRPQTAIMPQTQFEWDIVTAPYYPEQPGINSIIDSKVAVVFKTSKHQDEAFKFLAFMVSKGEQDLVSRSGSLPVLNDKSLLDNFGKDDPQLQGKHLQAYTLAKFAKPFPPRAAGLSPTMESDAVKLFGTNIVNVILQNKDVNTALREITELINAKAKEQAAK